MGPLLFIISVNDLLNTIGTTSTENVIMYADDTVLYACHVDPIICIEKCQRMLNCLSKWCNRNKLTVNISKTKHMFVPCCKIHIHIIVINDIHTVNNDLKVLQKYFVHSIFD